MVRKEINDQIDEYIANLRSGNPKSGKGGKAIKGKNKERIKEEVALTREEKEILKKPKGVYVIKKPKSTWQRMKERFGRKKQDEEEFEMYKTEVSYDVTTNAQEFEQEYDEVITEEKESKSLWNKIKKMFGGVEYVDEEYQEIDNSDFLSSKPKFEEKRKDKKEDRSVIRRIESFFFGVEEIPEEEHDFTEQKDVFKEQHEAEKEQMKNDIRDVAVITTKIAKLIPKRDIAKFKDSKDFQDFKTILLKYNVIRVRPENKNENE